jgi:hypothetical protein
MRRRALPLMLCALASGEALAQTPQQEPAVSAEGVEAARRLFREGVAAAQAERWSEAHERFSRTLAIRAAPIIRFNLAIACENLGRLVEAIDQYRQFARETPAGADPARVAAARARIEHIERRLAMLRVEASGDAVRAFRLDGRAQSTALLGVDIPVDPGQHTVDLEGTAGDRQRRVGAVYEGESMRVAVALSPTPAIAPSGANDWAARTQSFGHWVARPGPGGRWIDWAARATRTPSSIWQRRPFTLALQVGYGAPAGVLAVSARYFPQPWFGVEASAGGLGTYGPAAALAAHARITATHVAFGLTAGMAAGLTRATLSCAGGDNACRAEPSREASALALSLLVGLTAEVRLGSRFALRGAVGMRLLTNPADLRAMGDGAPRRACVDAGSALDGSACAVYTDANAARANPYVALDLGYGF